MRSIFQKFFFGSGLVGLTLFSTGRLVADERIGLNCVEFQSILNFVETQHLRFETMSATERAGLLSMALKETPTALDSLGYTMMSAQFERLHFSVKPSENSHAICDMLQNTIFKGAFLKSFIRHLDPYSDFYLSEELDAKSSALEGEFVGVGIGTDPQGDHLTVNEVVPDGPAYNKIFVGDQITRIDGHSVIGLTDSEVRLRIRGEKGSTVVFDIQRDAKPTHISIVRNTVRQKSVEFSWLDNQMLLIRMHRFFRQTSQEVEKIVLSEGPKARGFILDLRNNPGGLLQGARDVVDLFVAQGVVVYLKGRGAEDQIWALRDGGEVKKPLVVLVNAGTASAAEIVAGALQDYGRAVLVGQKTYGKGSVQNIYETQSTIGTQYRGGIKLTTLWYFLPSGRSVRLLEPDIKIAEKNNAEPIKHFAMPYFGPERIPVGKNFQGFGGVSAQLKTKSIPYGRYENSEEAGRALLLKMLAGSPGKIAAE